jgi:hypothetical protein
MPEEQNFATPPGTRPHLVGGRGVRRDFQCPFWEFPAGNYFGSIGQLTWGCDLLTDSARPLIGGWTPLGYFEVHTDN